MPKCGEVTDVGIVEAAGAAVQRVRRGDRVVLPAHIYCGVCFNCSRGDSAAGLRVYPGHVGGASSSVVR